MRKGGGFFMRMTAGKYRHYKGNDYEAFCLAKDANNPAEEPFVLYRKLYGDHGFWIRPETMFFEDVDVDGGFTPRFALTGEPEKCRDKITELKAIAEESGGRVRMRHSETMAEYAIVSFESDKDEMVLIERTDA